VREVFTVVENTKDGKDRWVKIGVAFDSEKGTSVILNALPVNGKLFIKLPKETEDSEVPF